VKAQKVLMVASLLVFAVALGGNRSCVPIEPEEPVCFHNGVGYEAGESFPAGDGCNTCVCGENDEIACTLMACGCLYGDQRYAYGEQFPADDGCNSCVCTEDAVACTEMYCPPDCDPDEEYWRAYMALSPEDCALIDFVCPESTEYFFNDCGCGCEMSRDCPEYIDCMPVQPADSPCNDQNFFERCPYTEIVW